VLQVLQATAGGAPLDAAAFVARWRDARLQPDR